MAEATSSNQAAGENLESTIEINIKTLDSQIYKFRVDKNMPVPLLKEKIETTIGVPAGQQRLIFRGRVLKDDHVLSEYHVEEGHTLHLVARQPVQSQNQSGMNSEEPARINGSRGNDVTGSVPVTRVGHSVVVGLNVSDQGEGAAVPDLSRVIGAVLNSMGIGAVNNTWISGNMPSTGAINIRSQPPQNVEAGTQNTGGGNQIGIQSVQIPLNGAMLRQMVIPDSMSTLSAYINRMEHMLSFRSDDQSPAPSNEQDASRTNIPSNSFGQPSPDALIAVMERAQQLLSGPAATALSHVSGRLERERASTDLALRELMQAEALHLGAAMLHLGSFLLELGRTISTLRIGESPAELMVNSGPAVYISSSGPNPIMVQPNTLQASPIFAIPALPPTINIGVPEVVSVGEPPRNISIRVHPGIASMVAGGGAPVISRSNAGGASHGQSTYQSNSSHSAIVGGSDLSTENEGRSTESVDRSHPSSGTDLISNLVAGIDGLVNTLPSYEHMQSSPNQMLHSSGNPDTGVSEREEQKDCSSGDSEQSLNQAQAPSTSSVNGSDFKSGMFSKSILDSPDHNTGMNNSKDNGTPVPLGLGLSGLQPKKRGKQPHSQGKKVVSNDESTTAGDKHLIAKGQEVLQSLISHSSQSRSVSGSPSVPPLSRASIASSASRGSRHVVNQNENLGGLLSGMIQQMMPVISQTLGGIESGPSLRTNNDNRTHSDARNFQVDLHPVASTIEHNGSPLTIFQNMAEAAGQLSGDSHANIVEAIGNDEALTHEYMEMLRQHLRQRLQSENMPVDKP